MSSSPYASGGQAFQTPPLSNTPKYETGSEQEQERKRKRETDWTALDSTSLKRTRIDDDPAHTLPKQTPKSPTQSPSGETSPPLRLDDPLYSPDGHKSREEESPCAPDSLCAQHHLQSPDPDPDITASPSDNKVQHIAGGGAGSLGEPSQEKGIYVDEVSVAQASKSIAAQQTNPGEGQIDLIGHWALENDWPQEYFTQEHLMNAPLTKKRSASTLKDPTTTPSEVTDASAKERQYRSPRFEILLKYAGVFMHENPIEPSESCKEMCLQLLESEQELPTGTLFQDRTFKPWMVSLEKENEAMVFRDMTPLIAPPAEVLYFHGAQQLKILHGHANMAWGRSIPLVAPPPQPDYCVGFDLEAFTLKQDQRLRSLIGNRERNPLMATWMMYFPFFMCEVKAGNENLDVADRQNMSSGSVAVNTLIALYRAAGREKELHGKILAFSIAHNIEQFRIYGHYASLEEQAPRFYRYEIMSALTRTPRDRWKAYTFTRNVYDMFAQTLFENVCSVIDSLPENASIWGPELAFQSSEGGDSVSVQSSAPKASDFVTTPAANDEIIQEPKNARSRKKE